MPSITWKVVEGRREARSDTGRVAYVSMLPPLHGRTDWAYGLVNDGTLEQVGTRSLLITAKIAAEELLLEAHRKLQHNPDPIKVVSVPRCRKCRRSAPGCTCYDGPDYEAAA